LGNQVVIKSGYITSWDT